MGASTTLPQHAAPKPGQPGYLAPGWTRDAQGQLVPPSQQWLQSQYGAPQNAGAPSWWRPGTSGTAPQAGDPNLPAGYTPSPQGTGPGLFTGGGGTNPRPAGYTVNPFTPAPPTLPQFLQPPSGWPQGGPPVDYPPQGPPDWTGGGGAAALISQLLQGSGGR